MTKFYIQLMAETDDGGETMDSIRRNPAATIAMKQKRTPIIIVSANNPSNSSFLPIITPVQHDDELRRKPEKNRPSGRETGCNWLCDGRASVIYYTSADRRTNKFSLRLSYC